MSLRHNTVLGATSSLPRRKSRLEDDSYLLVVDEVNGGRARKVYMRDLRDFLFDEGKPDDSGQPASKELEFVLHGTDLDRAPMMRKLSDGDNTVVDLTHPDEARINAVAAGELLGGNIGEVPTGVMDNVNTDFELNGRPRTGSETRVFYNGLRQQYVASSPGFGQYTVGGSTIELGFAPAPTDVLFVDYLGDDAVGIVFGEVPGGVVDGVNTTFSVAAAPLTAAETCLSRNGLRQMRVAAAPAFGQYSIVGTVLELGHAPVVGENTVWDSITAIDSGIVMGEVVVGVRNGVNQTYTMANTPRKPSGVLWSLNGLRQMYLAGPPAFGQYVVAATTLTAGTAPQAGDIDYADYELPI